ncbi:hypothetical protein S40285_09322, partial [Stachybotrys chlorohalonatus IBT 40285]
MGTVEP